MEVGSLLLELLEQMFAEEGHEGVDELEEGVET